MESERRRVPRHTFGGVVELTAEHPGTYVIAKTAELSRLGCFVRTDQAVPVGTKVTLKITSDGNEFNASGEIIYVLPEKGVGIQFATITHKDEVLLEEWLRLSGG
jgi:hypothetical protein